jgi:hypothetical protein
MVRMFRAGRPQWADCVASMGEVENACILKDQEGDWGTVLRWVKRQAVRMGHE